MPNPLTAGKYARDAKHAFKLKFGRTPDKDGNLTFHKVVRVKVLSIDPAV